MNTNIAEVENDSQINKKHVGAECAEDFRVALTDKFDAAIADGLGSFDLSVQEWDEFRVEWGHSNYEYIPNKKQSRAEWGDFRSESNTIRYASNIASSLGIYKEPAFEVVSVGVGKLEVRLLQKMVILTLSEAAEQVASLLKSRQAKVSRMVESMEENKDKLPAHINAEVRGVNRTFHRLTENLAVQLNGYATDVGDIFADATDAMNKSDKDTALKMIEQIELEKGDG